MNVILAKILLALVSQGSLNVNVPTDLSSGGALSSPVRDVRLSSRSVLNTGGPIGEVGANPSNSGDGKLLEEKPFPVTSPVYSYMLVKDNPVAFAYDQSKMRDPKGRLARLSVNCTKAFRCSSGLVAL